MVEHEHQRLAGRNPLGAVDGRAPDSRGAPAPRPTNEPGREHARMIRQPPAPVKSGARTGDSDTPLAAIRWPRRRHAFDESATCAREPVRSPALRVSGPVGRERLVGAARAELFVDAPESCVDPAALADEVSDLIGKPLASVADVDFRVQISETPQRRWRLRLETIDQRASAGGGAPTVRGTREIDGATCAELAEAASVAIAVSVRSITGETPAAAAPPPAATPHRALAAAPSPTTPSIARAAAADSGLASGRRIGAGHRHRRAPEHRLGRRPRSSVSSGDRSSSSRSGPGSALKTRSAAPTPAAPSSLRSAGRSPASRRSGVAGPASPAAASSWGAWRGPASTWRARRPPPRSGVRRAPTSG